jgi:hypothetical protein
MSITRRKRVEQPSQQQSIEAAPMDHRIQLDDEQLKAVLAKSIVDSLTPEARGWWAGTCRRIR